jgi:septal ring-binding cell division protein DamX
MFGIGKQTGEEKGMDKTKENQDEEKIEFDFEEDDNLPFADDENFSEEEFPEEEPEPRTSPSRSVILLGLLLLLALGVGGYYYLQSPPPPPVKAPAPVTKKVKVQAAAPVATTAPTAVNPAKPAAVAASPAATSAPTAILPAKPVAVAAPPEKTTLPAPAQVAAAGALPMEKSAVAVTAVPAARQPYTLAVGAFLSQDHLRTVEKKINRLGYTPKVQTTYSMVPMTRLLLGVYAPVDAAVRQRELATQVPELFTLKTGDKVALYAGSYLSLNAARSAADKLYLRGIHVDEETVTLRMPLKKISYGSFATQKEAEKAAKSAAAVGLTAQVIKR